MNASPRSATSPSSSGVCPVAVTTSQVWAANSAICQSMPCLSAGSVSRQWASSSSAPARNVPAGSSTRSGTADQSGEPPRAMSSRLPGPTARWASSCPTSHPVQGVGWPSSSSRTPWIAAWAWSSARSSSRTDSVLSFDSVMCASSAPTLGVCRPPRTSRNPCGRPCGFGTIGGRPPGRWCRNGDDVDPSGSKTPQQSLPAGTSAGAAPTVRVEHVDTHDREVSSAAGAESSVAHDVARAAAVPAAVLITIAVLNVVGAITTSDELDQPELWSRSVLVLVLLLVATQLVCLVLAAEHRAIRAAGTDDRRPLGRLWALRAGVVVAVAAAIAVAAYGEWGWGVAAALGALAEGVALLCLEWSRQRSVEPEPPAAARPEAGSAGAADDDREGSAAAGDRRLRRRHPGRCLRARRPPGRPGRRRPAARRRAAARAPRLRGQRRQLRRGGARPAPYVPHRRRACDTTPSDWRTAYATGSPELERLRRHTRYLFEPTWRTRDGIVSLLMGAVVNLLIVGLTLRVVAWLAAARRGLGRPAGRRPRSAAATSCSTSRRRGTTGGTGGRCSGSPSLCLVGIAVLTVRGWHATAAFDAPLDPAERQTVHAGGPQPSSTRRRAGGRPWSSVAWAGWCWCSGSRRRCRG